MIKNFNGKCKTSWGIFWRGLMLLSGFLVMSAMSAMGQGVQVNGTVTDGDTKEPIPGVNVYVDGTQIGVITDIDGKYQIEVPSKESVLVYSFIGFDAQKFTVADQTRIDVALASSFSVLDEVVAIGYGTVKKRDLTGAVSSVQGKDLQTIPVASAAEAMTGKLAGVTVTTAEGSPDAEVKIRVRGGGSITQSNDPLYIVDGFPVSSISDIPPSDIQSIDVLKDASSTAIYGSRGANGVVIITTKSGKEGKVSVSYTGYYGVKDVTKFYDVLDPYNFALSNYELYYLDNENIDKYESYFGSFDDVELYKHMNGTNWQDKVFGQQGKVQSHSLSLNGGTEKARYNLSYARIDDKSIMLGSNFNRDNFNFKLNLKPLEWVKFDFASRYSSTEVKGSGSNDVKAFESSTSDSRLKDAVLYTPIEIKDRTSEDDTEESYGDLYPPTVKIADNDRYQKTTKYNFNASVAVEPIDNLIAKAEIGLDKNYKEDNKFYGTSAYYVRANTAYTENPAIILTNSIGQKLRSSNTISYDFSDMIGGGHSLDALIGHEYVLETGQYHRDDVHNMPALFTSEQAWAFASQGTANSTQNSYNADDKLLSFFGRAKYDYKGRYLASFTYRADGSSKFADGNKWGYFPSAAFAWRVSDEPFLESIQNTLSNLKLRASYGTAGNNRIPALNYLRAYRSSSTTYLPNEMGDSYWGLNSENLVNPDLVWETTITRNLGIDLGLFNNRINGSFEFYWNSTDDLLLQYPTSGTGYTYQYRNIGETSNQGVDLSLNAVVIQKKDFGVNFSFNMSMNRNRVESIGDIAEYPANSGWTSNLENDYLVMVGQPIGQILGYKTDGWYSAEDFTWDGSKWIANDGVVNNSGIAGKTWGPGALRFEDRAGGDPLYIDDNGMEVTHDDPSEPVPENWMPVLNEFGNHATEADGEITPDDITIIGNALPKHTGGFSLSANYKGLDLSANFNWSYGNDVYNANKVLFTSGYRPLRNMITDMAPGKRYTTIDYTTGERVTDATALAEMNKDATIWAPATGREGFAHSWAIEDGSFLRLNNITIGYSLPKELVSKIGMQQLRFYVSGYNIYTWTNYSGFDPEVDTRTKTPLTPGVDYSAYPRSRTYNVGVNVTF